ncbi:MAG: hypothetical protein IJG87_01600 [Ruminococcus sp.]|nr:hypothetical protein [Ruminococcus sp.]
MKRIIAFVCVIVLAAAVLTACGQNPIVNGGNLPAPVSSAADNNVNSVVEPVSSAASSANTPAGGNVKVEASKNSKASDGLKVEGIPFFDDYSKYVYLLITNDSGADCDLNINVDFFNAEGKIVGTTSGSLDAVGKGTTVCEDFSCDEEFVTYEYKVVSSENSYKPVDQDLALDVSVLTNKVIVSLTNNGKTPARYVWYDVFFYNKGQLVGHNYNYCEDADSEIKPGATERSECSFYGEGGFDDAKVFFHGEGDYIS